MIVNAVIESTSLGTEDHGCFTAHISLDYGDGGHQGAGGYCLDTPLKVNGKFIKREGTKIGMEYIMRLLEVVGVDRWEDLPGKAIRVKKDTFVKGVGNLLKDEWLDFEDFFKEV